MARLISDASKMTDIQKSLNVTIIDGHYNEFGPGGAFDSKRLISVVIPQGIKEIRTRAFFNNQLVSVEIPDSVILIGAMAFTNNRLTEVDIPDSVKMIGTIAFANNNITSITIGRGIERVRDTINYGNYLDYGVMTSDAFHGNNIHYVDKEIICDSMFYRYNLVGNIILGNNVQKIGNNAFEINQLTSVIIPDSVTSIGNYAFSNNELTNVTIGNGVTTIGNGAFRKNNNNSNLNLASITINKPCSTIKLMSNYAWIGDQYKAGTTIYGANNEVCDAFS